MCSSVRRVGGNDAGGAGGIDKAQWERPRFRVGDDGGFYMVSFLMKCWAVTLPFLADLSADGECRPATGRGNENLVNFPGGLRAEQVT